MATQAPGPKKITWHETSGSGLCALNNLMIWRGLGNNEINLSAMPDDRDKWKLGQTTEGSAGAAFFNGLAWIAWKGTSSMLTSGIFENYVNVTTTANPADKVTLRETTWSGVALAAFNGFLFLAWVGTNGHLNVIRSRDGRNWQDKVTLNESSTHRPALAVFNNLLYLVWKGTAQRASLNILSSADGQHFGGKMTLSDETYAGPALAVFNNNLYMAWAIDGRLKLASSSNASTWSRTIDFNENSNESVALTVIGPNLVYCWTGADSRLNLMYL